MARDFSNPNTKLVEVTPEMQRKERERSAPSGGGMFASWNSPIEELDPSLVPADKLKAIQESQAREAAKPKDFQPGEVIPVLKRVAGKNLVVIPIQAIKQFKSLLPMFQDIEVVFNPEQAQLFLDELGNMKTPAKMSDAKAIVKLTDQLERLVGGA